MNIALDPRGLEDLLMLFALIDDGILLQQDGSLLTGWSYRGPDMMSAAQAEMDALAHGSIRCCALELAGWFSAMRSGRGRLVIPNKAHFPIVSRASSTRAAATVHAGGRSL